MSSSLMLLDSIYTNIAEGLGVPCELKFEVCWRDYLITCLTSLLQENEVSENTEKGCTYLQ